MKYTFVDVETPNAKNNSICSICILRVENNKVVDKIYSLINPEDSFDDKNINIHKITPSMVKDSPTFDIFWNKIENYFTDGIVVAHNATFDISVIFKTLNKYNISLPYVNYVCTLQLATKYISENCGIKGANTLDSLCGKFNINLECHHNAQSDTLACYEVFKTLCNNYNILIDSEVRIMQSSNQNYNTKSFKKRYSDTTISMQELKSIAEDIINDSIVSSEEILFLNQWINENPQLSGNYPFDKIALTCKNILADGIIEPSEQEELLKLLNEFVNPVECKNDSCSIIFKDKLFCLSGTFESGSKEDISNKIIALGGICKDTIIKKTDYLIVGGAGNDAWKFGNYGSKVAKALKMQDDGLPIKIFRESELIKCL